MFTPAFSFENLKNSLVGSHCLMPLPVATGCSLWIGEGFFLMQPIISGTKFNQLTELYEIDKKGRARRAMYKCDCGNETIAFVAAVRRNHTRSCGCLRKSASAKAHRTHGHTIGEKSPEYNVWRHIKARCLNKSDISFMNYGGRGIMVCDRWLHSFENFLSDMGERPTSGHSIERIENDGNYEPSNCRWATKKEQGVNKRNNHNIEVNGVIKTIGDWERETGVTRHTILRRLRNGLSPLEAISKRG